ncbi:MAG TPA: hypothetical protein VGH44_03395 [Candidatus Saccharimonadia bacterium]
MLIFLILLGVALFIALVAWALGVFVHRSLHDDMGLVARWLVGLLVVQFILGMSANLFQTIPDDMPWRVFHEVGPIILHALNGLVIVVLAVWLRILAGRQDRYVGPVALGGTAVAIAFVCGVIFVNLGQNDIYSFAMALGFIVALLEFAYVGFRSMKH